MSNIEFKCSNVVELATWFKRFSTIDQSLLFEIDTKESEFIGKTYSEDRSIVKLSRIPFADLGFTLTSKPIDERVKIGLYDISKINKILGQFAGDEFTFTVKYDAVEDDNGINELAGVNILMKSSLLKVGLECSSLTIFRYISDTQFLDSIANLDEVKVKFDLKKEDKERISVLSDLDKDFKKMSFRIKDKKVFARSKTFEFQLGLVDVEDFEFPILKNQFVKLDTENYEVSVGSNRSVLTSTDAKSISVIGILNENEYDSEKELDLN
jgi:hypothetical protein